MEVKFKTIVKQNVKTTFLYDKLIKKIFLLSWIYERTHFYPFINPLYNKTSQETIYIKNKTFIH